MEEYKEIASRKSDLERTELQKEKTGVFSGAYARNPANGEAIPIWVADYVLGRCGPFPIYGCMFSLFAYFYSLECKMGWLTTMYIILIHPIET